MQRLRAFRQLRECAVFQRLRERVEQAPSVAAFERLVLGFPPFMQHRRNHSVGAHTHVAGSDDKVVSSGILNFRTFVGGNPFILVMPLRKEQADGTFYQLRQIADDESRVFPGEFDLP